MYHSFGTPFWYTRWCGILCRVEIKLFFYLKKQNTNQTLHTLSLSLSLSLSFLSLISSPLCVSVPISQFNFFCFVLIIKFCFMIIRSTIGFPILGYNIQCSYCCFKACDQYLYTQEPIHFVLSIKLVMWKIDDFEK